MLKFFQLDLFTELIKSRTVRKTVSQKPRRSVKAIVKTIDLDERPAEDLKLIWLDLISRFFPERTDLHDYTLVWSKRKQKCVLASCNMHRRKVIVARELGTPEGIYWLEAVMHHELCHAIIGFNVETKKKKWKRRPQRQWHGRQFKAIEALHPNISELNKWIKTGGWHRLVLNQRALLHPEKP